MHAQGPQSSSTNAWVCASPLLRIPPAPLGNTFGTIHKCGAGGKGEEEEEAEEDSGGLGGLGWGVVEGERVRGRCCV